MYEAEINAIRDFINEALIEPKIGSPKKVFKFRSYSLWAADEILERISNESMRLPSHISGRELRTPLDITKEFIDEMEYYLDIYNSVEARLMFSAALITAKDILYSCFLKGETK